MWYIYMPCYPLWSRRFSFKNKSCTYSPCLDDYTGHAAHTR